MRHISTIPVFAHVSRRPATASTRSRRQMLGDFTWGDVHHPGLSQTDGNYDGRWLFVNDNANNRVARIDLRDFKTRQILGPIPNSSGNHGSSFVTENSEYVLVATRFSVPLPKGRYADPSALRDRVQRHGQRPQGRPDDRHAVGRLADPDAAVQLGPRIDRQGAELGLGVLDLVQLRDGADVARGQRDAGSIATTPRSSTGGRPSRRSRTARATMMGGVPVIDPAKVPGVIYFLPVPKSPHGIDTDPVGPLDRGRRASCSRSPACSTSRRSAQAIDAQAVQPATSAASRSSSTRRCSRARSRSASVRCTPSTTARATPTRRCSSSQRSPSGSCRRGSPRRAQDLNKVDPRQDPGALQHRPPGDRRQRHQGALRPVPGGDEQAVEGTPPVGRAVAAGVERAASTSPARR